MYFFISSLQRNSRKNSSNLKNSNSNNENSINQEILFRQENIIRNSLTKLVKESKEKKLKKNQKFNIDYNDYELNDFNFDLNYNNFNYFNNINDLNYNIDNSENEFSDDEISTENMSVDEIIEDLFMKENNINNDINYKRSLVISKLEEFKYKYLDKHLNRKEKECSICLEEFKELDRVKLFSCKQHIFHKDCIMKWLLDKDICPLCKKPIIY
jgi:hypothetical protein